MQGSPALCQEGVLLPAMLQPPSLSAFWQRCGTTQNSILAALRGYAPCLSANHCYNLYGLCLGKCLQALSHGWYMLQIPAQLCRKTHISRFTNSLHALRLCLQGGQAASWHVSPRAKLRPEGMHVWDHHQCNHPLLLPAG